MLISHFTEPPPRFRRNPIESLWSLPDSKSTSEFVSLPLFDPHFPIYDVKTGNETGTDFRINVFDSCFFGGKCSAKRVLSESSGRNERRIRSPSPVTFVNEQNQINVFVARKRRSRSCSGNLIFRELGAELRPFFPLEKKRRKRKSCISGFQKGKIQFQGISSPATIDDEKSRPNPSFTTEWWKWNWICILPCIDPRLIFSLHWYV